MLRAVWGLRRLLPGATAAVLALGCAAAGWPILTCALVAVLVALTPVTADLASRVMAGLVALLCISSVCTFLPLSGPGPALTLVVGGLGGLYAVAAMRTRDIPLVPVIGAADAIVLGGALAYGVMLALPFSGSSADDVLMDLSRGYDNLNHFSITENIVRFGAPPWPTGDGSPALSESYPQAVHQLIAALAGVGSPDSATMLGRFAGASVALAALAPAVVGWIGVRISARLVPGERRVSPASSTGLAFVAMLLLGADYSATFVVGHTAFFLPAAVGAGASWLALGLMERHTGPGRGATVAALGTLAAGAIGLFGAYPPLVAGLAPAGVLVLARFFSTRGRRPAMALALASAVLVAGVLVLRFSGTVQALFSSVGVTGGNAVLSGSCLVLTLILWGLVAGRAPAPGVLHGMLPALGYGAAALALLVGAAFTSGPLMGNYYATKMLEASWLVALPIALALADAWARHLGSQMSARGAGVTRVATLTALCLLLLALPVGRQDSLFSGPALLARRLLEAERARGQVMLVADAQAAGTEGSVASVVPEPNGWFLPVDRDDGETWDWTRPASIAAQWVMALRGVRTDDAERVTGCLPEWGDESAIPCIERWVTRSAARRLTVVLEPGVASAASWREMAARHTAQVRVVEPQYP